MSSNLARLKEILAEVTDLTRAAMLLEWDQETYMPPGGVQGKAEQQSTLHRLAHERFTSEEVGRLLDALEGEVSGRPFDSYEASLVRVTRRDYEQQVKVPTGLVTDIARAGATGEAACQASTSRRRRTICSRIARSPTKRRAAVMEPPRDLGRGSALAGFAMFR